MTEDLLKATLSAAVPLWALKLRAVPFAELLRRATDLGQVIAEKVDVVQFRSKRKGESAAAFNALAEAIAILSFMPNGVDFMGMHFENEHPEAP